jgi:hypothetical protein
MAAHLNGDHHLLKRYRREQEQAKVLIRETLRALDEGVDISVRGTRDPVDAVRLRGIPCLGRGTAGGAIRGTRPDIAVLRLDDRR